ncbi:MAG: hypothetical protein JXM70_14415, partial [Pirellulales bacterium]|nr:hypothetical protein [Pirellulales bacterium]
RRIDPFAQQLHSMTEIEEHAAARSRAGAGDGRWLEPGLEGVTIYQDQDKNGQLDWTDTDGDSEWDPGEGERWTITVADDPTTIDLDETGWYVFDDLPIGQYRIREIIPPDYVQTAPLLPDYYDIDLRSGPIASGYDFGNRPTPGSICGRKGLDLDEDGVFEEGEPGQSGVTIVLYRDVDGDGELDYEDYEVQRIPTGNDGSFQFDNVSVGDYIVIEETPDGFEQILPADHEGIPVHVNPGQTVADLLFVNTDIRGCLMGWKWIDLNRNNEHEDDEPGLAGVIIYLDLNDNGQFDGSDKDGDGKWDPGEGEQWAISEDDDPATTDVETGSWVMEDVVPGTYIVREELPEGYELGAPGLEGHEVTIGPNETIPGLFFFNVPLLACIEGWKFIDYNENCCRDRNDLQGDLLVFTIDVSDSTGHTYDADPTHGGPVGDVNGDGYSNTVLDLEIAGLIAVNQALIDGGLGSTQIAIVAFGDYAEALDMNPSTPEIDLVALSSDGTGGGGPSYVEQVLRSLQVAQFGPNTKYNLALEKVRSIIQVDLERSGDAANMLFLSDGEPDDQLNYSGEVATLEDMGMTLSAFGAGHDATICTLRIIDPTAETFCCPKELVDKFSIPVMPGSGSGPPQPGSSDGRWSEPGVAGVIVYLDENNNGQLDWADADGNDAWDDGEGERWTITVSDDSSTTDIDETGYYFFDDLQPGTHIVREIVPDGWRAVPLELSYMVDSSLLHFFQFDGDTVDAISGVTAKNYGADPTEGRFELSDTCYSFDGYAWMRAALDDLPLGNAPKTLSLWVQSADGEMDGSAEHIANWGTAATGQAFGLMDYWSGRWGGYMHNTDINSGIYIDTNWHHLVLSYDGTTARLFVDGHKVASPTKVLDTAAAPFLIGIRPDLSWPCTFDGMVDDIRIYDRALADNEVASLYTWEDSRSILSDGGYVVRVDFGDLVTDLNFGNVPLLPGDANGDGLVDVSDLGILAANYGNGSDFEWGDGDFTGDGLVDVSDLGLLSSNYGTSSPQLLPGDANTDGSVDVSDLGVLAANYGTSSGAEWDNGDFTGDGKVDVSDLGILAANYGQTLPPATAATASSATSAPEPDVESVPCDLDNDGQVGLGDLAFFSSVYGAQPGITTENPYAYAADFDGSGTVDLGDLAIFSSHYRQGQKDGSINSQTANMGQSVAVAPQTSLIAAAVVTEHVDEKVADDDIAILARHWQLAIEDINNDDDERDAVFAEVGATDDMLGLLDEY